MRPTFSVVIPCYNEEKYLGLLLDNLAQQTIKPEEVIIGDCNSTDRTVAVAMSFKNRLPIKIARTPVRSPGAARNAGAAQATKDYILFLDADCLPFGKNFMRRLGSYIIKYQTDFLTSMFTSDGWHPLDYIFFWSINFLLLTGVGFKGNVPMIGGMSCVRRTTFLTAGAFDEQKLLGEDTDYGKLLTKINASSKTLPWLYVIHSCRRSRQEGRVHAIMHSMPTEGKFWSSYHAKRQAAGRGKKYGQF